MKSVRSTSLKVPAKAPTGIIGFDEITGGGLPRGRATLLAGESGSGKTVFALQFLVHGAQDCREPGIFVAFEESSKRIVANAESFGWKLVELQRKKLFFMDAQPLLDLVQAGNFDLNGMLAVLSDKVRELGARRIVFDALDVVLALLPDVAARRREVYRLHEWLLRSGLTGLITLKAGADEPSDSSPQSFSFMQFMVDCAVILTHNAVLGVSHRTVRVQKFRGSNFDENESPLLIGDNGIEVPEARTLVRVNAKLTSERVSSGVNRLDTMLGGGYRRGASVLITGFSGTAKTTLSGAFAAAACQRGERTLVVAFDSDCNEVIRNLMSVGIRLDRHIKNGCLRLISSRTIAGSSATYLARIKALAKEHTARCLVIDPVSRWSQSGNDLSANSVADRLIDWAKNTGTTMICTSLFDEMSSQTEGSAPLPISSLVDTWIHLTYLLEGGERNRGLSIIKSRGTAHSNQVREMILSDAGVALADAYTAGGEVLMGTLRWQKENADRDANEINEVAGKLKHFRLDAEEAEIEVRLKALQVELVAKQAEKALLARTTKGHQGELSRDRTRMGELRGADAAPPEAEVKSP